jgi:hypothetical protein
VSGLLEVKNVNLRIVEKEDLPIISEWMANPDFLSGYVALWQKSRMEFRKDMTTFRLRKNGS